MYSSFEVKNLRCFQDLKISAFERVNLIAGMNNVGKTTLLEALFIHGGSFNPELTFRVNAFRGIEQIKIEFDRWAASPWENLFHQFDESKAIELAGENTVTGKKTVKLAVERDVAELKKLRGNHSPFAIEPPKGTISTHDTAKVLKLEYKEKGISQNYYMIIEPGGMIHRDPIPPEPPFPTFYLSPRAPNLFQESADLYGKLMIENKQAIIFNVLKIIEPRLKKIEIIPVAGISIFHGDIGLPKMVALPFMGEGMVRLANLFTRIANCQNGVILIDEIENGIHHSVMEKLWTAIGKTAREFNIQVFATTHNWGCIVAAHKAFLESGKYDFRLHRLDMVNGQIKSVTYDQESLEAALENNFEVR